MKLQQIVETVLSRAVIDRNDKTIAWIDTKNIGHKYLINEMSDDLYYGLAGILIFFIELKKNGINVNKNIIDLLDNTIKKRIISNTSTFHSDHGAILGFSSIIYAGMYASKSQMNLKFINHEKLVLEQLFNIKNDVYSLDFIDGLSGTLYVLSKKFKIDGDKAILKYIKNLSEEITARVDEVEVAGLAHGMAGIYLSLSEYYGINQENKLKKIIKYLIQKENKIWNEAVNEWRDLRGVNDYTKRWCNGSIGIHFVRRKVSNEHQELIDNLSLEMSLKSIKRSAFYVEKSNLCCGRVSEIFLDEVKHDLSTKSPNFSDSLDNNINLGLFSGITGLGLAILKSRNQFIPNILLLELPNEN